MAPSNVLPQTGGATQPAPSTQSTPDAPTIMDDPVEKEQIQTYRATNRRNLRLYFSEVGAQMHGPLFVVSDQRVEQIHQWLEEETFYSRCKFDEETNLWLARVKISTSSGIILHHCYYLRDCTVIDTDSRPGGC